MRKSFLIALIAVLMFGGGYFYLVAQAICPAPLTYSIGTIDSRFAITSDEVKLAMSKAESVWEDATGRNLFTYAEDGALVVNFVYDERQDFLNTEGSFEEQLNTVENTSKQVQTTYDELVAKYNTLKNSYTTQTQAYEAKLSAYNTEVEKYNSQGGAPAKEYAKLELKKKALDTEQKSLNSLSSSLNTLVKEINAVGEKGNLLTTTYNQGVTQYNKTYGEPHEFTQGDYTNKIIQVYTFKDSAELTVVLAHELGHALSLDHVEGKESIMYYLIGDQSQVAVLSTEDSAEFNRICGDLSLLDALKLMLSRFEE